MTHDPIDDETLAAYAEGRLTPAETARVFKALTPADRATVRDLFGTEPVPAILGNSQYLSARMSDLLLGVPREGRK